MADPSPPMSGTGSSHAKSVKTPSSSSLRKNPAGNRRKTGKPGETSSQPRAEFRGKSFPYYVGEYAPYEYTRTVTLRPGEAPDPNAKRYSSQPYARRELLPASGPKGGPVGPDIDWSVRARNVPYIFVKQLRDYGGRSPTPEKYHKGLMNAYNTLFPGYYFETGSAKHRPATGCYKTRDWSDHQVETWTKLAHWLGVEFSGPRDYSFPKSTLGSKSSAYDTHYKPFVPKREGNGLMPFFNVPSKKGTKRSPYKRLMRSLERARKAVVKPFDFRQVLIVCRSKSCREIRRDCPPGVKIRDYKDSIPLMLSLNTKHRAPVPDIVLESLKRISQSVSKLLPGSGWIVEKTEPIQPKYELKFNSPVPRQTFISRLRVYLTRDGNVYINRGSTMGLENIKGLVSPEKLSRLRDKVQSYQDEIDSYGDHDPPHDHWSQEKRTLGGWASDDDLGW